MVKFLTVPFVVNAHHVSVSIHFNFVQVVICHGFLHRLDRGTQYSSVKRIG